MRTDHDRMTEVAQHVDGDPRLALEGARTLRRDLGTRASCDPELLGWSRFYEIKALYALQRWAEVVAVFDRREPHRFVLSSRNAAWVRSVGAECAVRSGRPERMPQWMVEVLRLRLADGDAEGARMAVETALALSLQADDRELAAAFLEAVVTPKAERVGTRELEQELLAIAVVAGQSWFSERLPARHREQLALWAASHEGDAALVCRLLEAGVDADARHPGMPGLPTPLIAAAMAGHGQVVEVLLQAGVTLDAINVQGRTALHLAADQDRADCVARLLAAGAARELPDLHRHTPLHLAAWQDHQPSLRLLLAAGASVGARDLNGDTPLAVACTEPVPRIVAELLAAGSEVDAVNDHGQTALHRAAMEGQADIVGLLLAAGANPTLQDANGLAPAGWAAHEGHDALAALLAS